MILKQLEYSEFIGDDKYWAIRSFELGRINLFTAKNATGKTRTITAINLLSIMIKDNLFNAHANYNVEFSDNSEKYNYILSNNSKKVVFEQLFNSTRTLLQRDETGKGEMFTDKINKNIEFQIPEAKLAISRRDSIQYPYLEKIHLWAENLRYYSFGTSMKQEQGKTVEKKNTIFDGNSDNSVEVFFVGELEFEDDFKKNVLASMNSIGYNLNNVDVQKISEHSEEYILIALENDRKAILTQDAMSQGMFRALSIIIYLTYYAMMGMPTTILIDDIGEGLDYDRSTKLIKLLIELAEKNDNIQLIMSTNDRYVMNNVPLKYWQVIERKGGDCKVYNYYNSKEKFEDFKYVGLNNFDFLATDFINSKWEKV